MMEDKPTNTELVLTLIENASNDNQKMEAYLKAVKFWGDSVAIAYFSDYDDKLTSEIISNFVEIGPIEKILAFIGYLFTQNRGIVVYRYPVLLSKLKQKTTININEYIKYLSEMMKIINGDLELD